MLLGTHLVQRMRGPRPSRELTPSGVKAHHVFGGMALGLSKDAWKIIDPICTLDYMGAAEYEGWQGPGPVAKSLHELAMLRMDQRLCSFAFNLAPTERSLHWGRRYSRNGQKLPAARTVTIFGLCAKELLAEVQDRIRILAAQENRFYVKRGTQLIQNLDFLEPPVDPILGWFELNNSFLFFSDQKMWEGFCDLFEVQKCEVPPLPRFIDYSKMSKDALVRTAVLFGMYPNQTQAKRIPKPELAKALNDSQVQP